MFRRLVVGLAVAAFVAPAAQARVDDLGAGRQADQSAPVIQGDDKVFAPGGGSAVLIHGDDKVIVGQPGDSTVLVHGDDKVFAPSQTADYTLAGYRRALPQDYRNPVAVLAGDDKVIVGQPGDSTVLSTATTRCSRRRPPTIRWRTSTGGRCLRTTAPRPRSRSPARAPRARSTGVTRSSAQASRSRSCSWSEALLSARDGVLAPRLPSSRGSTQTGPDRGPFALDRVGLFASV